MAQMDSGSRKSSRVKGTKGVAATVAPPIAPEKSHSQDGKPAASAEPTPAKAKVIRDKPFAIRLKQACDGYRLAPDGDYGRLTWLKNELAKRFNEKVSVETVRKWFAGEARPRPEKMSLIARLLEVDEAWLSLGIAPDIQPKEQKIRNAEASGVVNLIAGLIQIGGGHPAFPEPGAKAPLHVDLFAIIKGAQYAFHVSLAQPIGFNEWRFSVPVDHDSVVVLGVIPTSAMTFDILELTPDLIDKHGSRKGGHVEIDLKKDPVFYVTKGDEWRQIESFAERL